MAEPFLGEVRLFTFNFPPKGWALCYGQLLPINQNQALFSLLGTTYGGDGRVNFGLPNLQGRMPMHVGAGYVQGQAAGTVNHTLTIAEMPAHVHPLVGTTDLGNRSSAAGNHPAAARGHYGPAGDTALHRESVTAVGGSQPHNNMPPYLVLSFAIALQGIFPPRN